MSLILWAMPATPLTLESVEQAIADVMAAIANGTEEYQYNGRRVRKSSFPQLLDSLSRLRTTLLNEQSRRSGGLSLARCRRG